MGGHDEDLKHVDVEARIIPRGTLRRFGDNLAISSRARPEWAGEDWPGTGTGPGLLTRVPLGYHRVPPDQEWTVVGCSVSVSVGAREHQRSSNLVSRDHCHHHQGQILSWVASETRRNSRDSVQNQYTAIYSIPIQLICCRGRA